MRRATYTSQQNNGESFYYVFNASRDVYRIAVFPEQECLYRDTIILCKVLNTRKFFSVAWKRLPTRKSSRRMPLIK